MERVNYSSAFKCKDCLLWLRNAASSKTTSAYMSRFLFEESRERPPLRSETYTHTNTNTRLTGPFTYPHTLKLKITHIQQHTLDVVRHGEGREKVGRLFFASDMERFLQPALTSFRVRGPCDAELGRRAFRARKGLCHVLRKQQNPTAVADATGHPRSPAHTGPDSNGQPLVETTVLPNILSSSSYSRG